MLKRLISFLNTLYVNRYMIRSFAMSDIKKRYTGSVGGMLWPLLNPLAMVFTYYVLFSFVFGQKVEADYGTTSYSLWLISGLVPWFYFNDVVSRSTASLFENKPLVTKTLFPSEIISVCNIVSGLVNHLIGLGILVVFSLVITGGIPLSSVFVVPYFLLMSVMILGLSWALSSLNVFMRDVEQVVGIAMRLWFFYTPIFYPIGIVPQKYRWFLEINPMYHVVEGYRSSLLGGAPPDPYGMLYLAVFSGAAFVAGGLLYKRLKPAFADVM